MQLGRIEEHALRAILCKCRSGEVDCCTVWSRDMLEVRTPYLMLQEYLAPKVDKQ